IAHREVHPQAIYKRQDTNGRMLTYQCISLDLNSKQAILKQTADSSLFTVAVTESETSSLTVLTDPVKLPLLFSQVSEVDDCQEYLTLEL
ncbi:MAG: hypothetical protein ACYTX0_62920, partial [Nostoc sp.]